jgi:hypothetical protein
MDPTPAVSALISKYSNADPKLNKLGRLISGIESSGGRNSVMSSAGAHGVMQVMPDTATEYGYDPKRLDEPAYNTMVGMAILKDLLKRANGDPVKAAIGYNAGPRYMDVPFDKLPKETQKYVNQTLVGLRHDTSEADFENKDMKPASAPRVGMAPQPPAGAPPAPPPGSTTNPMDTSNGPAGPGMTGPAGAAVDSATAGAHSALNQLAGHQDLPFILMNALQRDNIENPDVAARHPKQLPGMTAEQGMNEGILAALKNPKSNVAKAFKLYQQNPAAAMDEYGAGSIKQNQYMAKQTKDPTLQAASQFEVQHPATSAFETLVQELFNPMSIAEGGVAGKGFELLGKIPITERATTAAAQAVGISSPLAEIARRGGPEGEGWANSLINSVKEEDQHAYKTMMKNLGDLPGPEQWEVVRLSQRLKPDPQFMFKYGDLSKRATALRDDIKHVTNEQIRVGRLDPAHGDVFNIEKYFPMSNTHDFGSQWELEQQLKGVQTGGAGSTKNVSKVHQDVDESRRAPTWDPNASAAENYMTWRRQRMQGVAFDDAMERAPESLRRDVKASDYQTERGDEVLQPWIRNMTQTQHEALEQTVAENNAKFAPGDPRHITLKDQTEYVAAKNVLDNMRSPVLQRSMLSPELMRFMQQNKGFAKYVDQGGSFLPGEEEMWGAKVIGVFRSAILANVFYHPAVNVAGADAAMRGMQNLGGPVFERGGYGYNAAKAIALQVGLAKPQDFIGGAEDYAHWMDRALKAGATAAFGVSKKTFLGGDRARLMSSPIEDKAWAQYEPGYRTLIKRIDKALTGAQDWNLARTFGDVGEGHFALSLFKDAVEKGGMSDYEAGNMVRKALGDYNAFDPKSKWSAAFLFMPFLKSNTKLWTSVLGKRPQYITAPGTAIRRYDQATGDPAMDPSNPNAPPDYRIHTGKPGEPEYLTPPLVFRDIAKIMQGVVGGPDEALYEARSTAEGRANPFTTMAMDLGSTADALGDTKEVKGPETDFRVIWNPKAPHDEQLAQIGRYAIGHFVPVPLVSYAVQDAARRGWGPKDLARAFVSASGGGFASESMTPEQHSDVSRAQKAFLKVYDRATYDEQGADQAKDLKAGWDAYTKALKVAGIVN